MKTYFEKVEIKSEADLPKENGNYIVRIRIGDDERKGFWSVIEANYETFKRNIKNIDWYLRPVTLPDKKQTDTYNLRELLNDLNYNIETNLQRGIDNIHVTYLKNIWNKLSDEITKIEENGITT
jgi:hypothetical protein